MADCLLDDLHSDLHRGEKCPECGHDPFADQPAPPVDQRGVHFSHCYQGEYAGTCKYGDHDCPAAADIYVIWWTTQTDCEFIAALTEGEEPRLPEFPEWLKAQLHSRAGRNGRGRLWNNFRDAVPDIDPMPDTKLANLVSGDTTDSGRHSAAGIVVPLGDLNLVIGLPGFVTNTGLTRLLIHGVDLDL